MSKLLSVIIPRYKETEQEMFPLLSSINNQVGLDFKRIEVIIVDDAYEEPLEIPYKDLLKYDLRIIRMEVNRGPGVARQVGIDNSDADYVMFADADDIFHNVASIPLMLSIMSEHPDCEYASSAWLEEIFFNDKWTYVQHDVENTWMHGKIINRKFLVDNNIRFHPELRVHEDSYFLDLVAAYAKNRRFAPQVTYVWKWKENSITRRNEGEYAYTSFATFIKAITYSTNEIFNRNMGDKRYKVVQMLIYVYLQLETWEHAKYKDSQKYIDDCKTALKDYMSDKWEIWDNSPYEYIVNVYCEEMRKCHSTVIENKPLIKWVDDFRKE